MSQLVTVFGEALLAFWPAQCLPVCESSAFIEKPQAMYAGIKPPEVHGRTAAFWHSSRHSLGKKIGQSAASWARVGRLIVRPCFSYDALTYARFQMMPAARCRRRYCRAAISLMAELAALRFSKPCYRPRDATGRC